MVFYTNTSVLCVWWRVFLFPKSHFESLTYNQESCVCVCVGGGGGGEGGDACVSLASASSETIEVIIIKLSTVTASDTRIHHELII